MGKFIVITSCYKPNTAPINRLLSFLAAFDNIGIKTEMVFVYSDINHSKILTQYKNITIKYLWDDQKFNNKFIKYANSFLAVYHYAKRIQSDDRIFCFGCTQYLPIIVDSPAKVYHERTEHPSVVRVYPSFLQKPYLNACKKLSGMFVISSALKQYFETLGVKNVSVINMTVDPARFNNLKKQPQPFPYIGYCGTASNNKDGVNELIKSFAIVHAKYPKYKLVIMGETPRKNDKSENIKLVENLNLKESVIFTGVIPADQMPQRLLNADILALDRPNSLQAQYGFPTKLGEYLLTANPVVVTKVGDIPLFLTHKVSALLSDPCDILSFSNNLIWAIENSEKARKIGSNGYKIALKEFNSYTEALKIIKIIFV